MTKPRMTPHPITPSSHSAHTGRNGKPKRFLWRRPFISTAATPTHARIPITQLQNEPTAP